LAYGKGGTELLKMLSDPDERVVRVALRELVRQGIDPRTGRNVGVAAARKVAAEMGENMPG
jgi:hypothetical protein